MSDTRDRIKVGLQIPIGHEAGGDGMRWSEILIMAKLAEDVGFDSLWVVDHFLYQLADGRELVEEMNDERHARPHQGRAAEGALPRQPGGQAGLGLRRRLRRGNVAHAAARP